ncbi:MAG: CPBP family intramembrane metalloprotease [Planctomycetes bacterium]|nr:CPBP family intramembrane metalloprotease [Planctomycetota bacterium]
MRRSAVGSAVPPLGRNVQLAELLVFLSLTVPSMAISLFLAYRPPSQTGFVLAAVMLMLRDISLTALLFYFLWRNGEPISRIGWRSGNIRREVALGVILFVPFLFFNAGVERLFSGLGLSQTSPGAEAFLKPHGLAQFVLATALVAVVAVTEETIFRGYLLLRLTALSRSVVLAVVLSSLIFSIGHGYEGMAGVATVGVMGMVFAGIYLWRGSLLAPMTMHFLQDFLVIVVLGALASS